MTEITFHFNVADPIDYACRLLRKAQRLAAPVAVTGPQTRLAAVDDALWKLTPTDFIAHSRVAGAGAVPPRLHASTVWLATLPEEAPSHGTLVNLGREAPRGFESFDKLIEIVSPAEDDREAARSRWRGYQKRGYAIARHEAAP